jgi:uncharacterized protein (TIGR04255 family)
VKASGLPDFDRPPIVEVAIGAQFKAVPVAAPQFGLLWLKYRPRFPRIETKPALTPAVERFGVHRQQAPVPRFQILDQPPPLRSWFLTEGGDELIQVQPDRLVFNWRRVGADGAYPRYPTVERCFLDAFGTFAEFLGEIGSDQPQIEQCELTYVNRIFPASGTWNDLGEAAGAIALLSRSAGGFLGPPEEVEATARYVISVDDKPVGRLHVSLEPRRLLKTGEPLLNLQLTARGAPLSSGTQGATEFFRLAREWIVRGFVDVTTPEMHKTWGMR